MNKKDERGAQIMAWAIFMLSIILIVSDMI